MAEAEAPFCTVEREGTAKPVCVAESMRRRYP